MRCAMDATMKIGWGGGCRVLTIRPGNQQVFQSILHYARRWVLRRPGYCSKSSDSHGLPRPKQNKLTRKTIQSENMYMYMYMYDHVRLLYAHYTYTYVLSLLARPTVFWTHPVKEPEPLVHFNLPPKVCPCAACNLNDNIFWSLEICN